MIARGNRIYISIIDWFSVLFLEVFYKRIENIEIETHSLSSFNNTRAILRELEKAVETVTK